VIKKPPVLLALPLPITLPLASLNTRSAFGVSVCPVTLVNSAVLSAGLLVSTGVIVILSMTGAIVSSSIVASLLEPLSPNSFLAIAVNLCLPCSVRTGVVNSQLAFAFSILPISTSLS